MWTLPWWSIFGPSTLAVSGAPGRESHKTGLGLIKYLGFNIFLWYQIKKGFRLLRTWRSLVTLVTPALLEACQEILSLGIIEQDYEQGVNEGTEFYLLWMNEFLIEWEV